MQERCENCNGFGEVTYYKPDEPIDDTGCGTAHSVREECERCGGKGYIEEYVMFTVEEAQAIFKHCGLSEVNNYGR
jgi:DnaJ-class molecular chaperone